MMGGFLEASGMGDTAVGGGYKKIIQVTAKYAKYAKEDFLLRQGYAGRGRESCELGEFFAWDDYFVDLKI